MNHVSIPMATEIHYNYLKNQDMTIEFRSQLKFWWPYWMSREISTSQS
jgi:hypothetical protein